MSTFPDLQNTMSKMTKVGRKMLWEMHEAAHPHNFNALMECTACGHKAREAQIENDPAYTKRISAGFNVHGPGDGEPPEYVSICPECDAEESFEPVAKCAECDDYPCTCTDESAVADWQLNTRGERAGHVTRPQSAPGSAGKHARPRALYTLALRAGRKPRTRRRAALNSR